MILAILIFIPALIRAEPASNRIIIHLQAGLPSGATMAFARIPAGTFEMGNTRLGRDLSYSWCDYNSCELPRHAVTFKKPFYMGVTEVTQKQWLAVMGKWPFEGPKKQFGLGDNYPAYFISWNDAQEFVAALNRSTGIPARDEHGQDAHAPKFRLPSEAEWEYACRGSEKNPNRYAPFYFGDDPQCNMTACDPCDLFSKFMVYSCNSKESGCFPAGSLLPNDYGLYDMHGNVCEWCEDAWHDDYNGAPVDGSAWLDPPHFTRVLRGGYWWYGATACRTAYRAWLPPDQRDVNTGLRVVMEIKE